MTSTYDALVIGSGPNGLSAAIALARAGHRVKVFECYDFPGGGARSAELTQPGFVHDVCSSIHPMAVCSPFFNSLPLEDFGLEWIYPESCVAHPLDDGSAAVMYPSLEKTVAGLGEDGKAYHAVFEPLVRDSEKLFPYLLGPPGIPGLSLWFGLARFGLRVLPSANRFAQRKFKSEATRALFAGNAAHSFLPLDRRISTSAIGIMLMLAGHVKGWPFPRGGAGKIAEALVRYFESLGGEIECSRKINLLDELPPADVVFFDTRPADMAGIAGDRLPASYRNKLERFRHGPGVFKIDYALSEPVPWTAENCRGAGTVHAGGTLEEIASAELAPWEGKHSEKPFVLTAQHSLFDPSRTPETKHTFWAYCHVPVGSTLDMTEAIENQIERFAPGFRDCVLDRHTMNCVDFECMNPNLFSGDIVGGVADWKQLLSRPTFRLKPHSTPNPRIFICSASTPPGGGVHGMGGFNAVSAWQARQ